MKTMLREFRQVDVFTTEPYRGNALAVVLGADGLSDEQMSRFANWTNLSETTFVLEPDDENADYRVRIFTPSRELPFAGHPTLGTCHAWLEAGRQPRTPGAVIQDCKAGLVTVGQDASGLRFAAPPLLRTGPVDEALAEHIAEILRIGRDEIVDLQWADNGPGWIAVLLGSAEAVLALRPGATDRHWRRRATSAGWPGGFRGARVRAQERRDRRGSGDWQPERLAGAMAAGHRPGAGTVPGTAGHCPGQERRGPDHG
jgi:PhzF family phenazine biosynthesis protein